MQWKPNVTVAAVVMQNDKFLLVEEMTDEGIKLNQPAGHLEHGESLEAAIKREMLEETACEFEPKNLIGIYQWPIAKSETTYLRFTFTGTLGQHFSDRKLDDGIIQTLWFTPDEIYKTKSQHRNPLVIQSMQDFLDGRNYPLDLVKTFNGST